MSILQALAFLQQQVCFLMMIVWLGSWPLLAAIVLYDILLTFSREVSCIWRRQWNLVTVIFVICRYGTLLDLALRVIGGFYVPDSIWVSFFNECKLKYSPVYHRGEYKNDSLRPDPSDWLIRCKVSAYTGYVIDVLVLFSIAGEIDSQPSSIWVTLNVYLSFCMFAGVGHMWPEMAYSCTCVSSKYISTVLQYCKSVLHHERTNMLTSISVQL